MPTTLAAAADEAYAAPACVALLSAATAGAEPLACVFLDCGCRPESLELMRRAFAQHGVELEVHDAREAVADLHVEAYVSRATYGSLLAPQLTAARGERTLFLDCDTLTLGDPAPLLATDLHGMAVGAVRDAGVGFVSNERGTPDWQARGLPPALSYFNAGVLLIDNARWAAERVSERTLELLRERPGEIPIVEQGALNATLAGAWWPLEQRWNYVPRPLVTTRLGDRVVSRRAMERFTPPAIVHFVDRFKPWHRDYPPSWFRREYAKALRRFAPGFPQPEWSALSWAASRRKLLRTGR